MKLRLFGDVIRLRLTKTEVDTVGDGETVTATTHFPGGGALQFSLGPGETDTLEARFDGEAIRITAPSSMLRDWAHSERVALQEAVTGQAHRILVEKDFACLSPRDGHDDDDTFPHPETGRAQC